MLLSIFIWTLLLVRCINCDDTSYDKVIVVAPNSTVKGNCNGLESNLVGVIPKPEGVTRRASVKMSSINCYHISADKRVGGKLDQMKQRVEDFEKSMSKEDLAKSDEYALLKKELYIIEQIQNK